MLTGEFASLEESTKVYEFAAYVVFPADRSEFIRSERRTKPRDPTRKLRLPIVRSISWSRFAKTGARVGGCGSAPNVI
jgi:hypothetical protein